MRKILQRLFKVLAYTAAGLVIFLAIALGLFRLFLPRLPEYQENIKAWASDAIGMEVQFSGMNARWGWRGPEVEFYRAELISLETDRRIVAAGKVSVGIGLTRFLTDRTAVVDRVVVRETTIEVRQLENGQWWIQGGPPDQLLPKRFASDPTKEPANGVSGEGARIEIIGEDLTLQFLQPGDERPRDVLISQLLISRDDVRVSINAQVELPGDLGESLSITATQMFVPAGEHPDWQIVVEAEDIALAGVSTLHTSEVAQFDSGRGDVRLSLRATANGISHAVADVDFDHVSVAAAAAFSFAGQLEFLRDDDGWLVAANQFRLETANGLWPLTNLRAESGTTSDGKIDRLDIQTSYLKLDDASVLQPWLPPEQQKMLADYAPDGVVRDLKAILTGLDSDLPRFDIAVELDRIGFAAYEKFPGVRGFSGVLRSDATGGLFEIRSNDLSIAVPPHLAEPVYLDELRGTLIWRRSANRTTLLSDSIVFGNADFDFETNVELTLEDGARLPVVDLAATWSINDVSVAKKYIPYIPRIPRTSEWFQEGLLAGSIPRGTVRLYGPMDKWPFDGGEGRFLVEANLRDALILYQRRWPVASVDDLDIVIDNTRMYTERNVINSEGNEISNARIEIGDFRAPILEVSAHSAGPMDAMRALLANSPIGTDVFKGNLDRVTVTGDGSFDLNLQVPIRDWRNFEFSARVQANNATMQMQGFPAPLTDLSGVMTVGRKDISSESLAGTFLGSPVSIDLRPAPATMPDYRIIATANGTATAAALIDELGIPLAGSLAGATEFEARILFARGEQEVPKPFSIELSSTLAGIGIDLPQPFNKAAEDLLPLFATIELPSASDTIITRGSAQDFLSWRLAFTKAEDRWDLDRGVVAFGDEDATEADIRGLHFRGHATEVRMQDWFDRAQGSDTGMGDRIRSVDMLIDDLYLFGQHIVDHRVRLDRSAEEWLVQFEGSEITGSAFVPYDFTAGRPLVIDMQRLVLPGDDDDADDRSSVPDPRRLPPITIKAGEFALGTRFLGAVSATLQRTADGLETGDLITTDKSFEIVGNGRWVVDEADPAGSHSYLRATMTSTDVGVTMTRLGYDPGIDSDDLSLSFDLDWSGGPRDDFRDSLNGEALVSIGSGQLSDVDPGAGRMMGLMSVVALPRRLSLDFRDVFAKGFGFDQIRGRFVLNNGQTFTCNLSLEGPAAQIGVVGRAGLVDRDYDQTAAINASFGNALPVVGAVLGGPTVAAVVLIFSQIFKKPLAEVSQVYYGISGSWDKPIIESVTAAEFAEQGVRAGCIDKAE
ncbi:MAG: YhdP family protein [Proteobacteria bacterium]|nr:YhdP family protein [Pseudomonadota bacterium]